MEGGKEVSRCGCGKVPEATAVQMLEQTRQREERNRQLQDVLKEHGSVCLQWPSPLQLALAGWFGNRPRPLCRSAQVFTPTAIFTLVPTMWTRRISPR